MRPGGGRGQGHGEGGRAEGERLLYRGKGGLQQDCWRERGWGGGLKYCYTWSYYQLNIIYHHVPVLKYLALNIIHFQSVTTFL